MPVASADDIDILVEQISDVIARPVRFASLELETTVSAGLAGHLPRSCEDAVTVLNNADIAMYHAKKRGRNRHCWFDPVMEQELRRRGRIEAALAEVVPWVDSGLLRWKMDVVEGIERMPVAVNKLFDGSNDGKLVVRV